MNSGLRNVAWPLYSSRQAGSVGGSVNYAALFQSAIVALLRNKMRSILTVLGITIGIAAVICVVAIGKAGQSGVEQQLLQPGRIAPSR